MPLFNLGKRTEVCYTLNLRKINVYISLLRDTTSGASQIPPFNANKTRTHRNTSKAFTFFIHEAPLHCPIFCIEQAVYRTFSINNPNLK